MNLLFRTACLYSGLIFGGFHFINLFHQSFYITTLQVIQVTCLGLVLCALYLRSGSLILPIMLHAAIDFISFISSGPEVDAHLTLRGCLTGAVVYIVIAFLLLIGGRRRIAART
ncbi:MULTISPECIES: CPBP family intramembrane glutamic endopeptidase [Heyndrickxia]|uniref:CPBP family intramembrane glutamic endopeptidase n=1 Tax=Heyndrickxia TaxID=2837504 RepID=UPI001F2A24D7|nr:CPBP family intramembrane glutamic endopeptidase [Heyndrickxia coagulans]